MVAGLANEVKVPRMAIRMLKPKPSLTKINLSRDASLYHPLKGSIDSRSANLMIITTHDLDEIISAEMALLPQKDIDDQIALARPLPTRRTETLQIRGLRFYHGKRVDYPD